MNLAPIEPAEKFWRDVSDPRNREAEDLVIAHCRRRNWDIVDWRPQKLDFDIEVHHPERGWESWDIKADKYVGETARVPFEIRNDYHDGFTKLKWGMSPDLDYLALVSLEMETCRLLRVRVMRDAYERWCRNTSALPRGWAPIQQRNGRYTTIGIAIPLEILIANGAEADMFCLTADGKPAPPFGVDYPRLPWR